MLMHYCPALRTALELSGECNFEIQILMFCNCCSGDQAATKQRFLKIARLISGHDFFKLKNRAKNGAYRSIALHLL